MSGHTWPCEVCGVLTDQGGMCGPCWSAGQALVRGEVAAPLAIPKRAKKKPGESEVLRRIREAVGALEGVTLWRNNTGMLEDRHGTKVRFGLCEGSADLIGCVECYWGEATSTRVGRFFALEVKQPGKKPTAAQHAFLDLVRSLGGHAAWVDNVKDALAEVELARAL